jgi:hypothetical protein
MVHLRAYHAAVDGKHRGNKIRLTTKTFVVTRRLILAAAVFFVTSVSGSASHAQTGTFNSMAGNWTGGGAVVLEDGSSERIRCRSSDSVGSGGAALSLSLTCASDSYRFEFKASVVAEGGALSGSWSEASRGITGSLQGRGGNGNFQVVAFTAGFNANILLRTGGNRQSISIKADGQFNRANISLSR